MRLKFLLASFVLALGLTACGGGGEFSIQSGDGDIVQDDGSAPVAITRDNFETVAGISISLAQADLAGTSAAGDAATGVATERRTTVSVAEAAALAVRSAIRFSVAGGSLAAVTGATLARSEACEQGGAVRISITSDDDNLLTLDPGDQLELQFDDCDQRQGEIVDGQLELTVVSLSGRLDGTGSGTLEARFTDLRFSSGADSLTANGTMHIEIAVDNGVVSASARSDDMHYRFAADGDTVVVTVREGSIRFEEDAIAGTTITITEDYVVISADFSGVLRILTESALEMASDGSILSGRLRVDGFASVLWLTFLAAGQVMLELDDDNDGLVDITRLTTLPLLPFALP
ncbi:MAG: hypothetical protein KDH15_01915 [Rhodocyclaceae bacterium]|nr:hypothetical protein [Rhodocyclaceae bacterium]